MSGIDAILISGPTASGKTSFALDMAGRLGGEIINADSMQVYRSLPILTAQPSASELLSVPHHLLGVHSPDTFYSVAVWLSEVEVVLANLRSRDCLPIFVGGTGLYYKALLEGLAPVPDIPDDVRQSIRSDLRKEGSEFLHRRLQELDPEGAQSLNPQDSHRIARALEVVIATGRPLSLFRNLSERKPLLSNMNLDKHLLMPPRDLLHERINQRVHQMVSDGVVDEVRSFLALDLPPQVPLNKAIGVSSLSSHIAGDLSLDEAIADFQTHTRRYAKRQYTWFNNQFGIDWHRH